MRITEKSFLPVLSWEISMTTGDRKKAWSYILPWAGTPGGPLGNTLRAEASSFRPFELKYFSSHVVLAGPWEEEEEEKRLQ